MEHIEALLAQANRGTSQGFTLWDEYAIEVETAFLLHALVRQAKPILAVESGTGQGISTAFLAQALVLNTERGAPEGRLVTFEANDFFREATQRELHDTDLPITFEPGVSAGTKLEPQFVFIDCVSDMRVADIEYWLTHPDRPLTVIHDARRTAYPFHLGEGVFIPGHDGVWIGRAKEN